MLPGVWKPFPDEQTTIPAPAFVPVSDQGIVAVAVESQAICGEVSGLDSSVADTEDP
jgi:hypothetical protein